MILTNKKMFEVVEDIVGEAGVAIVKYLKDFSLPSLDGADIFMTAPHFFQIELANQYLDLLINLKAVVITSVNINYGADGRMAMTKDGFPKHMNVQVSFRDRYAPYNED